IRYRNLQNRLEREAPGKSIPDEFEAQFQIFDDERQSVRTRLESAKTLERSLRVAYKEADKIFGQAAAAHQAEEGRKEAFLISQEIVTMLQRDSMTLVIRLERYELSEAAREILEPKGDVSVDSGNSTNMLDLHEGDRASFV